MAAIEFQIGAEMDFFRFFLARTDIISVLNLTRNSPVTTEDLDEMRSVVFFSPAELSGTVKLLLRTMAASEFSSELKWTFFDSFLLGPTLFRF